jgi:purine-binding chemotaxis protein CheW
MNAPDQKEIAAPAGAEPLQVLVFRLGDGLYGVEIASVREIIDAVPETRVPRTPEFLRGVINLRGSVVPVVDFQSRFGLPAPEEGRRPYLVILETPVDGESATVGILADAVLDVLILGPESVEPPPKFGARLRTEFLTGIGKHEDRFILLLNLDRIFSAEEMESIARARDSETPEPETVSAGAPA